MLSVLVAVALVRGDNAGERRGFHDPGYSDLYEYQEAPPNKWMSIVGISGYGRSADYWEVSYPDRGLERKILSDAESLRRLVTAGAV